jgi:hypothetical protein
MIFAFAFGARSAPIEPNRIEVLDGDTIRVGSDIFRLVGFNTPEPERDARCEAERSLPAKASSLLRKVIARGSLDLERVPCACPAGTGGTSRCN